MPVDWKRIYEEFDKLPREVVERLEDAFRKSSPEKLRELFLRNPWAQRVYTEKLKLAPVVPVFTDVEIEEIRRERRRKFEVEIRARGLPIREGMLRFDDIFIGWAEDVRHLAYKSRDEALKDLESLESKLLEELTAKHMPEKAPPVPPVTKAPAWDHDRMVRIWWDVKALLEAAGVPPEAYRDEAFKKMSEYATEAEAREALKAWAEDLIRRFPPAPPAPEVRPPAPTVPYMVFPPRMKNIITRRCWICGKTFQVDYDLEQRLRTAGIINFPAIWYQLCEFHKENGGNYRGRELPKWGFRSIEDAVAYRLVEGRSMAWKKTGIKGLTRILTEDDLLDIGLTQEDLFNIRLAMRRWLPPEEWE